MLVSAVSPSTGVEGHKNTISGTVGYWSSTWKRPLADKV